MVLKLMDRYPGVITLGAGLLGWIGGEMIVSDVGLREYIPELTKELKYSCAVLGALLVMGIGTLQQRRIAAAAETAPQED